MTIRHTPALPAEELLFLGAPLAHVAARNEHFRLRRIDEQSRQIARRMMTVDAFNMASLERGAAKFRADVERAIASKGGVL